MGTGFAGSDYLDAIVRRGFETDALSALAEFVRQKNVALHLVRLPQDRRCPGSRRPLVRLRGRSRAVTDGFCPFIRIAGHSWDSFLSTIGPAHRATTRRRLRALERNFTMRFEPIADGSMRPHVLAKLFDFHRRAFRHAWARRSTPPRCAPFIATRPSGCR